MQCIIDGILKKKNDRNLSHVTAHNSKQQTNI